MFKKIQYRLLVSYLVVFATLLGIFAIAVRVVFTRSLTRQLTDKLTVLGEGAAANVEFEDGQLKVESDFRAENPLSKNQSLQWFDLSGRLVVQKGNLIVTVPFTTRHITEIKQDNLKVKAVIIPITNNRNNNLIGYVRASQSLEDLEQTLNKLDWGLGVGIVLTLIFSGIGGAILTRQAMQPIEESFQRLKQFTADASHELRSPLMAIKTNAEVALEYPEEIGPKDAEKFSAIASAASQITRLTEDLLLLVRTDQIPNPNGERIDLKMILENLEQMYQTQYEAKQINLKTELFEPLYLCGDSWQITRLFANLIQNALHYTPSGGKVQVTANQVGSHLIVSFQDTGIGIAPEHLKLVFDRFWRADKSRSYWDGGSGLGLAIAQAIAQHHGGKITVTSQLGVGSCFTVLLPAIK